MNIIKRLLTFFLFCLPILAFGQVGIGTNTPNNSAALDIQANNKGLLIPRLTTIDRNAISNPAQGLLIYNTTIDSFQYRNANTWVTLHIYKNNLPTFYDKTAYNLAIGAGPMDSMQAGFASLAIGDLALNKVIQSVGNVAIGFGSLNASKISTFNVAIGAAALSNDTTGIGNTIVGCNAGIASRNGSYNTLFGSYSDVSNSQLTNATAIGYLAIVDSSNKVRIGNNNVISTEIAGRLKVNAEGIGRTFTFPTVRGTNGQVLTTDGNGATSWQNVQGIAGPTGPQGPAGPQGATGANGQGVPAGGTAGQVLTKIDGTDYNTAWASTSNGGSFSPALQLFVAQTASQGYIASNTTTLVDFGTPSTNVSNQFNTTNETFTAAVAGWYYIQTLLATTTAATGWEARVLVNNALVATAASNVYNDTEMYATAQTIMYINANETVRVNIRRNNSSNAVSSTATGFLRILKLN